MKWYIWLIITVVVAGIAFVVGQKHQSTSDAATLKANGGDVTLLTKK